ncbi:FliM/FliN family flagellar motor C-terminal domain-containing protein [Ramlibacter sp. H39-3-26]|uniref:FliM/FliN family flagellar motor C-terminal domain-containing protein n=1 Tax=Curvibacter soli TaxID=3031331 RepID=UPI0023D9B55C|nr:FliM/FliN family flagellar motor C-terminal domain-containing protein [Ramlibacter sp. H39-3-26]MDF1484222.1 FliM/FliN family flagellar motor C-terminal domain-containing protein [Ramlibacter sp. H39-3-26]
MLDARTLGRPVHLLPAFAAQLGDRLCAWFDARLNRRYRAAFTLSEVVVRHGDHAERHPPLPPQWQVFGSDTGRLGVFIDRPVLLAIFGYRYGLPDPGTPRAVDDMPAQEAAEPKEPGHTQTEERLAAAFGLQLAQLLADCIEAPGPVADAGSAGPAHPFVLLPTTVMEDGAWTFHAEIRDASRKAHGRLWLCLDDAWMTRLLQQLARPRRAWPAPNGAQPLAHAMQLTMLARLLHKEMPLGQLLDLRVGDVIPVTLGPTEVLIDDSRLFTAAVAEHKGKLCLTSFEDAE